MATIQWFPGHMVTARRKAAETMARTDLVIEVLDARIPEASANPMIAALRAARNRPCVKILNKSDLACPDITAQWLAHFRAQPGVQAVALNSKAPREVARLPAVFQAAAPHRADGTKPLRMMIMGIPNVGKSTLMNALLQRRVARVGDEPAVTKSQQTLDLGAHMTITDTPGMMWPKIERDADGFLLAICHAIGVNALIEEDVAEALAALLLRDWPGALAARYRVEETALAALDAPALVDLIGRKRGCLLKGGALDREKAARILLTDFRAGHLGRISLETPASRAADIAAEEAAAEAAKHEAAAS